jgi:predicted metalloprotease with PDZ domain
MNEPIHYSITPSNPHAHLYTVCCSIADPNVEGQVLRLPTWVPGSYLIREFARHIVALHADCDGAALPVTKIAKDAWRCAPCGGTLSVTYDIYAWDLSVRAAHLDATHGYFNGASVFLYAEDKLDRPCAVEIVAPSGEPFRDWRVATSMPRAGAPEYGFGRYLAANYDELIDHPVEMGTFALAHFDAGGVRHDIAITGRHRCDTERLARDLTRICQWQIDLFGGKPQSRAPMKRYLFQILAVGDAHGGLEHRASTTLLCARHCLPTAERVPVDADYRDFLGLASHEYFHTWNIKRIKPAAFTPYDFAQENYTRLLWAFEGITSYYDDLALLRSGLITVADYLELLGRNITSLLRGTGRFKQTVAESSFDAWIKFYRADENAPNAIVSYYVKGALIALALDLTLRRDSAVTLDDLMRALWRRYGQSGAGVPEDGVEKVAQEISARDLSDFFARYVYGTDDLPLAELLGDFGVTLNLRSADNQADKGGSTGKLTADTIAGKPWLGARLATGNEARITHVYDGGAAQRAGLAAGDIIVAADGLRVTNDFETQLARRAPGPTIVIHAFRRDELMVFDLPLLAAPLDTCWLTVDDNANADAATRRTQWLGAPTKSDA